MEKYCRIDTTERAENPKYASMCTAFPTKFGFVSFFRNIISSPEYGHDIQSIVNASDYYDFNFDD